MKRKTDKLITFIVFYVCSAVLLLALAACGGTKDDSEKKNSEIKNATFDAKTPAPETFDAKTPAPEADDALKFDSANKILLTPKNAASFDPPIIIEGDDIKNFGGWLRNDFPSVTWNITIPEDGDYRMTFEYSREEEGDVEGQIEIGNWDEEQQEWLFYYNTSADFKSTNDWSEYISVSIILKDLEAGRQSLEFNPGDFSYETLQHFINLRSIQIEKTTGDLVEENDNGLLMLDTPYFEDGDSTLNYFVFLPDGTMREYSPDDTIIEEGEYTVQGSVLTAFIDGEDVGKLEIIDEHTLQSEYEMQYIAYSGSSSAAQSQEGGNQLTMDVPYYVDGDTDSGAIVFNENGIMQELSTEGRVTGEGEYKLEGSVIVLYIDGVEFGRIEIIDEYILQVKWEDEMVQYVREGGMTRSID